MNFLNLTDTSMPLETVKEKLSQYCATSWDKVRENIYIGYIHKKCSVIVTPFCVLSMSFSLPVMYTDCILAFELPAQIKIQHPTVNVKYLAEYCFSGTYILTLLTEGYDFTAVTYSNIKFIKKVSRSLSSFFLSLKERHPHLIGHTDLTLYLCVWVHI